MDILSRYCSDQLCTVTPLRALQEDMVKKDYSCPECQSGFIEQLSDTDPISHLNGPTVDTASQATTTRQSISTPPTSDIDEWSTTFLQHLLTHAQSHEQHQFPPLTRRRVSIRRTGSNTRQTGRHLLLENLVTQMLGIPWNAGTQDGAAAQFGVFNPGDFAWGPGGIDIIVTQLLNQMEGTGAPPADKHTIDNLPKVSISQSDIDKTLQCSVCMDNYKLGEEVRELPCQHKYHTDCIVPWLELHGTCPVCRKDLNGDVTKPEPTDLELDDDSSISDTNIV